MAVACGNHASVRVRTWPRLHTFVPFPEAGWSAPVHSVIEQRQRIRGAALPLQSAGRAVTLRGGTPEALRQLIYGLYPDSVGLFALGVNLRPNAPVDETNPHVHGVFLGDEVQLREAWAWTTGRNGVNDVDVRRWSGRGLKGWMKYANSHHVDLLAGAGWFGPVLAKACGRCGACGRMINNSTVRRLFCSEVCRVAHDRLRKLEGW